MTGACLNRKMEMTVLGQKPDCNNCQKRLSDLEKNMNAGDDWKRIVNKIKDLLGVGLKEKVSPYSSVIETDFETDKFPDRTESHLPGLNCYGAFEDAAQYHIHTDIMKELEHTLSHAREHSLHCELVIPSDLTSRIAQDILRMSQNEPCGIQGAVIFVQLQEKSVLKKLGSIVYDPSRVSTFELYLTFIEDTRPWVTFKKLLISLRGVFQEKTVRTINSPKVLNSGFQLVKKKLYRPN